MFLNHHVESLDYTTLPEYSKLTEAQKRTVHEAFERGYLLAKHMGVKVALGKGHETAKLAVEQMRKAPKAEQPVPPSIFAGLDNC